MTEQTTEEREEGLEETNSSDETTEQTATTSSGEDRVDVDHPDTEQEDPETFPRAYVQKLRDESAKHRQRAADRDALAQRLHTALVAATGRLADPEDLPYDDAHLADDEALSAALDELLSRKPYLASRKPVGDIGQGATGTGETVDLAGILRARA